MTAIALVRGRVRVLGTYKLPAAALATGVVARFVGRLLPRRLGHPVAGAGLVGVVMLVSPRPVAG